MTDCLMAGMIDLVILFFGLIPCLVTLVLFYCISFFTPQYTHPVAAVQSERGYNPETPVIFHVTQV